MLSAILFISAVMLYLTYEELTPSASAVSVVSGIVSLYLTYEDLTREGVKSNLNVRLSSVVPYL